MHPPQDRKPKRPREENSESKTIDLKTNESNTIQGSEAKIPKIEFPGYLEITDREYFGSFLKYLPFNSSTFEINAKNSDLTELDIFHLGKALILNKSVISITLPEKILSPITTMTFIESLLEREDLIISSDPEKLKGSLVHLDISGNLITKNHNDSFSNNVAITKLVKLIENFPNIQFLGLINCGLQEEIIDSFISSVKKRGSNFVTSEKELKEAEESLIETKKKLEEGKEIIVTDLSNAEQNFSLKKRRFELAKKIGLTYLKINLEDDLDRAITTDPEKNNKVTTEHKNFLEEYEDFFITIEGDSDSINSASASSVASNMAVIDNYPSTSLELPLEITATQVFTSSSRSK